MKYLVKAGIRSRGRNSVVVAEKLAVFHPQKTRPTGRLIGGLFREVENAGGDRKRFEIAVREGTRGTGEKSGRLRERVVTEATAFWIKKVIRRLRPQEEEKLAEIDARRRALFQQIDAVETERDELVREAFSRGNVVRVSELEQMVEEREREAKLEREAELRNRNGTKSPVSMQPKGMCR